MEKIPNQHEQEASRESGPDRVPSEPEVREKLMEYIGGAEYTERRKLEDEKGVYLLELVITNEDGTTTEYSYARKGVFGRHRASHTAIDVTFFDADGIPTEGNSLLRFDENGEWTDGRIIP